jgi:alkylation response protein AidB-like acyl-CoA dehydrogenase
MDLRLNPSNADLVNRAKSLARDTLAPRAAEYDRESKFPRESFDDLIREGFTHLTLPNSLEGRDLYSDPVTYVMVMHELAKGCTNTAMLLHMHNSITHFLITLGTPEQQEHVASLVHDGKIIGSHGGESGTSSQWNRKLDTRAERVGDKFVVNGHKAFCSMAGEADYYTIWCQIGDDWDIRKSLSFFLAPADNPGFTITKRWNSYAMRGTVSHSILIENVEVPLDARFGKGGDPLRPDIIPKFGLGYSAVYLGAGAAAFDWVVDYAKNRKLKPDNVPIATYLPIQRMIGEMKVALEQALLMIQRAAWTLATHGPEAAVPPISGAKYTASEASALITDKAIKVAGGPGLMRDYPLERLHREARAGLVMPPNSEKCLDITANAIVSQDVTMAGTP